MVTDDGSHTDDILSDATVGPIVLPPAKVIHEGGTVEEKCERIFRVTERDARRNFDIRLDFGSNCDRNFVFKVKDAGKFWFLILVFSVCGFESAISKFTEGFQSSISLLKVFGALFL